MNKPLTARPRREWETTEPDLSRVEIGSEIPLTDKEKRLVTLLCQVHGGASLSRIQSKGKEKKELRIADPVLLEKDGVKELRSRHLSVNINLYLDEGVSVCGRCVKDGRVYSVQDLLSMRPIEERLEHIPKHLRPRKVSAADTSRFEEDANGNLIPMGPGDVESVSTLSDTHPAVMYLRSRDLCPESLARQFRCVYCNKPHPKGLYGKLPAGLSKSPEGRLVFYIDQLGVNRGWQARTIDMVTDDGTSYMLWDGKAWIKVATRPTKDDQWSTLPRYRWDVKTDDKAILKARYIIGAGTKSSESLLGFDAALDWAKGHGDKTVGVCEGVLDAGKLGTPFVSLMGMVMSHGQMALIANHFRRVIAVPDNADGDYEKFMKSVRALEKFNIEVIEAPVGEQFKDAGELPSDLAQEFRRNYFSIKC